MTKLLELIASWIWRCDAGFLRCCGHRAGGVRNEPRPGCKRETDMYVQYECCRCGKTWWKQPESRH